MYIFGLIPAGSGLTVAERFEHAGFAALWAPWEGAPPVEITEALAREHDRVVRAAHACEAILPCPAGTVEAEAGLRRWMEERGEAVLRALEQVTGKWEFSVRLPPVKRPPDVTGRTYLAHLRREDRSRTELRAALERLGLVHETAAGRFEVLVPHDRASELRSVASGAVISGPWPPYYFAGVMVPRGRTTAAERDPGGCGAGTGPAGAGPGGAGAPAAGA